MDGNWGQWGHFGLCNTACKKSRSRSCNNPAPENGGAKCLGGNGLVQVQSANCNQRFCGKCVIRYLLGIDYVNFTASCISIMEFVILISLRKGRVSEGP